MNTQVLALIAGLGIALGGCGDSDPATPQPDVEWSSDGGVRIASRYDRTGCTKQYNAENMLRNTELPLALVEFNANGTETILPGRGPSVPPGQIGAQPTTYRSGEWELWSWVEAKNGWHGYILVQNDGTDAVRYGPACD